MRFKKKIIATLFFVTLVFINCSEDKEIDVPTILESWQLKNVYGGLQGLNIDYNSNDVKWTFDKSSVTIINNIISTGPEQIHSGLSSGIYNYDVKTVSNKQVLYINNQKQGEIIISFEDLKIDDNLAADGFLKTFTK